MSYFGYSPAPSSAYNNSSSNQLLGSPTSSGGGMSGSASPTGITPNSSTNSNHTSSTSPPSNNSCCDGGRPLVTDPVTGQSVCSCQYDPARLTLSSAYPRLAAAYGSGVSVPYAPATDQNPYPTLESSAFYSPLGGAYAGLKEGSGAGDVSSWVNPGSLQSGYYSYDPTFAAAYGYGGGYDLAARRKNATRESTATLKAWLSEHKKNPYPTKGEKIMLAIITKMTLTQVSTWFANARRRLKKENKMTWEPKNKTDDDDEDMKDDDDDCDSSSRGASPSPPTVLPNHHSHHNNNNTIKHHTINDPSPIDLLHKSENNSNKPKIWSLADTAACKTPPPPSHLHGAMNGGTPGGMNPTAPNSGPNLNYHHLNHYHHHHSSAAAAAVAAHAHQFSQHAAAANAMAASLAQQHPHHHPAHGPPPVTSSWSFALPGYGRSPYGGFLPPSNPNDVITVTSPSSNNGPLGGTDTPPQTPPNLKVPLLPGSLSSHHYQSNSNNGQVHPHPHHHPSMNHHHPSSGLELSSNNNTAFKPVLKSTTSGFCV